MLKTICAQPQTNANARVAQHTNATCTRTPHKHPYLHLHCTHILHLFESYLRVARCALCATPLAPTNARHKHSHTCTPTHSQTHPRTHKHDSKRPHPCPPWCTPTGQRSQSHRSKFATAPPRCRSSVCPSAASPPDRAVIIGESCKNTPRQKSRSSKAFCYER